MPLYPATVSFEDGFHKDTMLAGGDFDDDPGLDFLIGRDLLQHAHLCFHGPNGTLEITFLANSAEL